jgi:hypothetical protein
MSDRRELLCAYGVKLVTLADGEIDNGLTYSPVGDYTRVRLEIPTAICGRTEETSRV